MTATDRCEAARAEGMAAVAGLVLALADRWEAESGPGGIIAEGLRAAIPADASEAMERVRAKAKAEALREAADARRWTRDEHRHVRDWLRERADRIEADQSGRAAGERGSG